MSAANRTVPDSQFEPAALLQRITLFDGVLCAAFGLLLVAAAGPLADLFDLPALLLRLVGVGLLPWAAFVLYIATRTPISRSLTWVVVAGNGVWTIASLLLLVSSQVDPSALGYAFVIAQAVLVAIIAETQIIGLRRVSTR